MNSCIKFEQIWYEGPIELKDFQAGHTIAFKLPDATILKLIIGIDDSEFLYIIAGEAVPMSEPDWVISEAQVSDDQSDF